VRWLLVGVSLMLAACGSEGTSELPRTAERLYQTSCYSCHEQGRLGAPKRGDVNAWRDRPLGNPELMLQRVVEGFRGMPAKGMCHDCNEQELHDLVQYLVEPIYTSNSSSN